MHFIGSGHIPLEHTETLQESPDLILALLDFAPEILGLARLALLDFAPEILGLARLG